MHGALPVREKKKVCAFLLFQTSLEVFLHEAAGIIGASLSEPHTSVTALLDACVCMYVCAWPYTENLN